MIVELINRFKPNGFKQEVLITWQMKRMRREVLLRYFVHLGNVSTSWKCDAL